MVVEFMSSYSYPGITLPAAKIITLFLEKILEALRRKSASKLKGLQGYQVALFCLVPVSIVINPSYLARYLFLVRYPSNYTRHDC